MTKILGIAASMRGGSHTRRLMEIILAEAQKHGAETRLLDLRATALPMLHSDQQELAPNLALVKSHVDWADAFILGSPDYHGSMSGSMKNFLDHFWKEFSGKLFGYIVASHEKGLTVQDQMRTAVRQVYGWSLPYGIGFDGDKTFNAAGEIADAPLAARARMLARDMAVYGGLLSRQFEADKQLTGDELSFARRFGG